MVEAWRSRAGLYAMFAAAAIITAGCSPLATVPEEDQQDEIETLEAVELDPAVTKLDEANIGVSGPEQIEEAIETLDAESRPPLVSGTVGGVGPTRTSGDLFERIRTGFVLDDVDHDDVERQVRWFASHPTYLDRTFKRGERYLYHIVSQIEARKMPLELALLPVVESAFNPVAYSRARASGLWQFIPGTGRRYDLKQNWYYDGRRDVIAATDAALDYLQFLSEEFEGDWLLAVAAYNCGEANIARAIARNRKAGKPTDFFSLKLPRETRAYVPKLLAMRRIVNDPAAHGLEFAPIPNEPYFVKIDVAGQIDLHVAAELAELAPEELLALNPAFNHWVTDPDGPYELLVPVDRQTRFSEAIAALPPEKRVRVVYHHVRKGDTLGGIADKYGVSVAAIRTSNKIRGTLIRPGQDLLITAAPAGMNLQAGAGAVALAERTPRNSSDKHIVRRGDTLWSIARSHGVSMESIVSSNGLSSDDTLAVGQVLSIPGTTTLAATDGTAVDTRSTTYVVRRGDTLARIASKFRVRLSDLLGWNDLTKRSIIKPGQRLVMYVADRRAGI
jgi:membrane-bound lytic murein transglycosylase D